MAEPPAAKARRPAAARKGAAAPRPRRTAARVERAIPAEKFPHAHPALRRALYIHYGMEQGFSRGEAVELADEVVGPRAGLMQGRTRPKRGGERGKG